MMRNGIKGINGEKVITPEINVDALINIGVDFEERSQDETIRELTNKVYKEYLLLPKSSSDFKKALNELDRVIHEASRPR